MNSRVALLLKINIAYWRSRNPYFSASDLSESTRAALTLIKRRGFLVGFCPSNAMDCVSKIKSEISEFNFHYPDCEKLALIFDLIQAWGGRTGRRPYVEGKSGGASSRMRFGEWGNIYLDGARLALEGRPVDALREWKKIYGLGASFASKHLMFWSGKYPVLDTRISMLLCGSMRLLRTPDGYGEFLSLIDPLCRYFKVDCIIIERALFAFSSNYFVNNGASFRDSGFDDGTDIDIARKLAEPEGGWPDSLKPAR